MTEEVAKVRRLQKVAAEFGVGVARIVEHLKSKGIVIENKPTAKITDEMYEILLQEFQAEKTAREKSQQLNIGVVRKPVVDTKTASNKTVEQEEVKEEDDGGELLIRNTTMPPTTDNIIKPKVEKLSGPKIVGKVDLEKEKKEKPAPAKTDSEKDTSNITEADIITKQEPEKTENINTPTTTALETEKKEEIFDDVKSKKLETNIRVVGTLSDFEKNIKKSTETDSKPEQPTQQAETQTEKTTSASEPDKLSDEKKEEVVDDNFIKTEYVKLTGPNILGKIELDTPREEKKHQLVASSSADENIQSKKKKRKRIRKGIEKVGDVSQFVSKEKEHKHHDHDFKEKEKFKDKRDKNKKSKHQPKEVKIELSEEEIQKQIKETLARLSSSSKSKAAKYRRQKREHISQQIQEEIEMQESEKNILRVTEFVTVNELATMMNVPVTQIIATCMSLGIMVSINQRLDAETLVIVAEEFGYKVEFTTVEIQTPTEQEEDREEDLRPRPPIITVMGHVDHGKTSLLDYIRKTNVIAGEAGGITQHIGAYSVTLENGKNITFLDTPGHEAFTAMRARGAKVTDIVIVVVAADDSVMPQTKEAISHAQAAGVPIVIAINKIDKPGANPDKIREELAQLNILVEEWGGKYQCQEISAKKGINIDLLLDKVLLEAELLDLKANPNKRAQGTVIESSLDKGRGYVATVLVQNGTLKIGDFALAGLHCGRVKAMYNERGQAIKEAGPSTPVLVLGLDGAPQAGDTFVVMEDEHEARSIALKRQQLQREQGFRARKHVTLDEIGRRIAIGDFKELNIIIKGDVDGSVEALRDSFMKLSTEKIQVNVIQAAVGQVSESDVLLAAASNAIIVAFQVRPSVNARKLAEAEQIDIRQYSIIYDAINEVKAAMEGMLSPEIVEKVVCNLEVKETFKISKVGTVAGCLCLDGKINRNTKVRVIRDGIVVYTGVLASLKRFKDDVKEVVAGQECGLGIQNFNDIKVGDIIEGYEETEVKAKL